MTEPSVFTRFFWFCSGANTVLLRPCPQSEHNRFVGIGAAVFFTGVLAAFSGGYALYTAFGSVPLAILFGLFWGGIIFNLDRFMVSTIRKSGSASKQFMQALPRLLLAFVLAIVISKPLELRIFEPEILEVLADQRRDKLAGIDENYQAQRIDLESKITTWQDRLTTKEAARERDYQDYKCECDGTCGTGKVGRGSECERKEQKYLQSQREYRELQAETRTAIEEHQEAIRSLGQERETALQQVEESLASGLVARLRASGELPLGPRIMLPLLILLVEISPILAKLLAPKGPYDEGLERAEQAFVLAREAELREQTAATEQRITLANSIAKAEREQQVREREKTLRALSDAQLELRKTQIEKWLEEEKRKLDQKGK